MKIFAANIQNIIHTLPQQTKIRNNYSINSENLCLPTMSNISFRSLSPRFLQAKQYLNSCNKAEKSSLYHFDLNKLDGIQEGIKSFHGLNMKEIAFFLSSVREFALFRGCYNMCAYCYADAKPPLKENDASIHRMSWEDFKGLMDDIKELNSRLGFNVTTPIEPDETYGEYITPFHDADCIDIILKDKNGCEHDFIDISKELYETTNRYVLFDTAGWFPNNKSAQERAEKFVEYFKRPENFKNKVNVNISLNPFHSSYTKSIILAKEGKAEQSKRLRDLYTTRMANVLFTFTPLLRYKDFEFNARALQNGTSGLEGFCEDDLNKLFNEIMTKLKELYIKDLNSDKKHIKSKKQMLDNLHKYKKRYEVYLGIDYTEKLKELSNTSNEHRTISDEILDRNQSLVKNSSNIIDILKSSSFYGILDANGKYYLTSFVATFPTDIELNLKTKGKSTAPIRPNLQENIIIDKNKINTIVTE